MTQLMFIAASTPQTSEWTPLMGVVMVLCNILAIAIGKQVIPDPAAGPSLGNSEFFGGMGLPALLATTSLGHILGFGTILGLANIGIL